MESDSGARNDGHGEDNLPSDNVRRVEGSAVGTADSDNDESPQVAPCAENYEVHRSGRGIWPDSGQHLPLEDLSKICECRRRCRLLREGTCSTDQRLT